MASQAQVQDSQSKRKITKRAANGHGRRSRRPARSARSGADVSHLEQVIRDLERRIAHLTSGESIRSTVSGATSQVGKVVTRASNNVGDLVADTLTDVADRLRGGAKSATGVARAGVGAVQKIGAELERRPLMTVAIALGIGFLAGLAGRREQAS